MAVTAEPDALLGSCKSRSFCLQAMRAALIYLGAEGKTKADETSLFACVSFDRFPSICWILCDGAHFPSPLKDTDLCPLQLNPLTPTSHPPVVISETHSVGSQHSCPPHLTHPIHDLAASSPWGTGSRSRRRARMLLTWLLSVSPFPDATQTLTVVFPALAWQKAERSEKSWGNMGSGPLISEQLYRGHQVELGDVKFMCKPRFLSILKPHLWA